MSEAFESLLLRADALLGRLENLLPPGSDSTDWDGAVAFRWQGKSAPLRPIVNLKTLSLADIHCIPTQKAALDRNTRQFLAGLPANNVLLWGSRGTGKSSLIKALLGEYADRGLRLIEVDRPHLADLPDILERLDGRPERFILFCDDLSFEADDASYKMLKASLEGSLSGLGDNLLIYATSNRRHLLPEYLRENLEARHFDGEHLQGEIHHGDTVEEKISLSERFGLWLSFHPFTQDDYLDIVRYWLTKLGNPPDAFDAARPEALRFALLRGSRSGRVAWQFAKDWTGRMQLPD